MKTELELHNKFNEVIKEFKNGDKLYNESPEFHTAISMLVQDCSPYDVIEQLCTILEQTKTAHKLVLMNAKFPPFNLHNQ